MFGQGITIPKGKQVSFRGISRLNSSSENPFLLEEDLTIRISSNYAPITDSSINTGWNILTGFVKGITGKDIPVTFKQFGYQQWTGTDPIGLTFSIGIYMHNSALEDVVKPVQAIMALTVPRIITNNGGLTTVGTSLYSVLFNGNSVGIGIDVGAMSFDQCFIKTAEPTFSYEVDSEGYPIWCKLRIDAATLFSANTSMIENMFKRKALTDIEIKANNDAIQSNTENYMKNVNQ